MVLCSEGMVPVKVGFVGAGMMAGAMIRGLVSSKTCLADCVIASDAYQPCVDGLAEELGITSGGSNKDVALFADLIVLAVKPQMVEDVCADIKGSGTNPLVVSIAAGVTIESLEGWLGSSARVVRVMPNTPCLVGELAAAYAPNAACSAADAATVSSLRCGRRAYEVTND